MEGGNKHGVRDEEMKLSNESRWILSFPLDRAVKRNSNPRILTLEEAVEWIRSKHPIIWAGSALSVPEPSAFPSGYSLAHSLFSLIVPQDGKLPEAVRESFIARLTSGWPMEMLFDEFDSVSDGFSESLLDFFSRHDSTSSYNALHEAIVKYYEAGLAEIPLCVTTNWDTYIERAFQHSGMHVVVGSPTSIHYDSAKPLGERSVFVYHPHGSFATKDVICSFAQEQQQPVTDVEFMSHPVLFIGYSGYEPSQYRNLEHGSSQLWCIRDETDLQNPAKRRLLCRENTYVYVGDMLDLLKGLAAAG